jgi:hypothetical protein
MRGGFALQPGSIVYNCFNCQYKTGWRSGQQFSRRFRNLLTWFGVSDNEIQRLNFKAFQLREQIKQRKDDAPQVSFNFKEDTLPAGSRPFVHWLSQNPISPDFLAVVEYLQGRGDDVITQYDWHWTPDVTIDKYGRKRSFSDRIIIPFRWYGKVVGWTARSIRSTEYLKANKLTRYVTSSQPNYLFNVDVITPEHQYIILCEGPFDALAINGVATLGNHLSASQCDWLNNTGKIIIVLPDLEKGGGALVDAAIKHRWCVSFPDWDRSIKDASDAVKFYGRIYPIWAIIEKRNNSPLYIAVVRGQRAQRWQPLQI